MPRPGKAGVAGMVQFGIPGMDANDNKPKGKMTAYAFFVQICRDEHKRKHPDEQVCYLIIHLAFGDGIRLIERPALRSIN